MLLVVFKQNKQGMKVTIKSNINLFLFTAVVSVSYWNKNDDSINLSMFIYIKSGFEIIYE